MTGRLYINGNDAYTKWGVYVEKDGYNELIAMPPLKTPTSNDWHEQNGLEVDLKSPKLDTHNLSIKFIGTTDGNKHKAFISHLVTGGAYNSFNCKSIGRKYNLRYVSVGSMSYYGNMVKMSVKFADDYPLNNYSRYTSPSSSLTTDNRWKLDNIALTQYGCRILKGTLAELERPHDAKQNLLRNIKTTDGVIYDGNTVTMKSRDVKLQCLMTADTLTELWRNYDALLYDLKRGDWRTLYAHGNEYKCYYKSCSVSKFYPTDKIWLQFAITITVN